MKVTMDMKNFGSVTYQGATYLLLNEAFLNGNDSQPPAFQAEAIRVGDAVKDRAVPVYAVLWDAKYTREEMREIQDEEQFCDWAHPTEVQPIPFCNYDVMQHIVF